MRRTNHHDHDRHSLDRGDTVTILILAAVILGTYLALAVATHTIAGAETRPDYHNLGRCAPNVTVHHNGDFAYTVPDGCPPQRWHHATFDLAATDGRHQINGQTLICDTTLTIRDGVVVDVAVESDTPGGCDTANPTNRTPGAVELALPAGVCGTQQDMWIDGDTEPYASWVLEIDGGCGSLAPPATIVAAPPNPPTASTLAVGNPGSADVHAATGSSRAAGTHASPPPAASTHWTINVIDVDTQPVPTLPNTGRNLVGLAALGLSLTLLGILALCGHLTRWGRRQ